MFAAKAEAERAARQQTRESIVATVEALRRNSGTLFSGSGVVALEG
jgi:hypothetical protein